MHNQTHDMAGKRSYGAFKTSGKGYSAKRVAKRYKTAPRKAQRSRRPLNMRTGGWIGLERKFLDTGVNNTTLVTNASAASCEYDPTTMRCLNAPLLGDGQSNREGRQIALDSITIKGTVSMTGEASLTYTVAPIITVMLVLDTQTNGAQLNSEDVIDVPLGSTVNGGRPFQNLQYEQRFKILKSVTIRTGVMPQVYNTASASIWNPGQHIPFTLTKSLKGLKTNFTLTGTDGTIATIADNSLHLIATTSSDQNTPKLYYNSRLRFFG